MKVLLKTGNSTINLGLLKSAITTTNSLVLELSEDVDAAELHMTRASSISPIVPRIPRGIISPTKAHYPSVSLISEQGQKECLSIIDGAVVSLNRLSQKTKDRDLATVRLIASATLKDVLLQSASQEIGPNCLQLLSQDIGHQLLDIYKCQSCIGHSVSSLSILELSATECQLQAAITLYLGR